MLALVPYFSTVIGTVGMDLDQMRAWFDRPAATTLQITAAPGVDPKRLIQDVRDVVPAPNHVYDGRTALAGLEAPLRQSMFIANAVWIIVVFVAAVALLNTLTLSVLERRREIGVLRAMGSSRRFTLGMVLTEAVGIGVVGGVLGLMFGLTDQWLYSLVSGDIMNFNVDFRPSPMALVFTARRDRDESARLVATRATSRAAEHHRGCQRRVADQKPSRTSSVNSSAKGSSMGMAIEKFKNGLMNVLDRMPGNPDARGPEPQVVFGVSAGSQNISEERISETNATIVVVIRVGSRRRREQAESRGLNL